MAMIAARVVPLCQCLLDTNLRNRRGVYLTPESRHTGKAQHIREERSKVLRTAYDNHPERFVKGNPVPPGHSNSRMDQ